MTKKPFNVGDKLVGVDGEPYEVVQVVQPGSAFGADLVTVWLRPTKPQSDSLPEAGYYRRKGLDHGIALFFSAESISVWVSDHPEPETR